MVGVVRHWCLVVTGANQSYIFGTNRLRHVVGASHLVYQVGKAWVPEAVREARVNAEIVLAISGRTLLLVDEPAAGQAVIGAVSRRALEHAPGLEVTGVVGPGFDPALAWKPAVLGSAEPAGSDGDRPFTHVEALEQTYELLEATRQARPSLLLRDPMLPWFEVCRDSGYPAAGLEDHPDSRPAADADPAAERRYSAAPVLAKSRVRRAARDRMREVLSSQPEVVPDDLDDLRHDGWIAVIHADGNGVGQVFRHFPGRALRAVGGTDGLSLDQHADKLHQFAVELEVATETALGVAVRDATAGRDATGTILPVVVGGDDVTVVCHAGLALELARAFGVAFEEQTAGHPAVRQMTDGGLTAAAGIAYVKPHHPFSAAYGLAEELTASAKHVCQPGGRPVSSLDFHVAFESTLTELAGLRAPLETGGIARYGGPYVITGEDGRAAGRDITGLDRAMRTVSKLSSSMAHYLREGLAIGGEEYDRRLRRVARSADRPAGVRREDVEDLAPAPGGAPAAGTVGDGESVMRTVRLLDALLLAAVARPSAAAGRDRVPAGAETAR